jgi:hypothetical protein
MRKVSVLRRGLASCSGIFAYSLFGLLLGSIGNFVHGAFVVRICLLLDTVLVCTFTRMGRSCTQRRTSPHQLAGIQLITTVCPGILKSGF